MREISPATSHTVEEFLSVADPESKKTVDRIRSEKKLGVRQRPSAFLLDSSEILNREVRAKLIDKVSELVDENLFGRSEMCMQFAQLMNLSLRKLGVSSKSVIGNCIYLKDGKEVFRWKHAWVRVGDEIIDGNVDIIYENPLVPTDLKIEPYWGDIKNTPLNRKLRADKYGVIPEDSDVTEIWWPELQQWIEESIHV